MEEEKAIPHYWGETPEEEYYKEQGIKSSNFYYKAASGLTLFTKSWQPIKSGAPRGVICMDHGYGNGISWTFQAHPNLPRPERIRPLDLHGHGRSQGLKAYVPNVDDALSFFDFAIAQDPIFEKPPKFLYGESMGGAICLLMHFKRPEFFKGAILMAPMCKISEKVKPRWPIPQILTAVARFAPTLAVVPTADLLEKSVKVGEKKIIAAMNPMMYKGKPRLGTVVELIRVTECVSERLRDVEIPFVVMHGDTDVVTDPDVSRELYELARSEDKSIKIYEGMMHSLVFGETDENVAIVRADIIRWLEERCD
ncbi:hypothetical protein SASPL_156052 [Salvia splendens]|uniref:Serine aminopeptidase S33 domain-containing protein n=1 Tax=Salvia splendens TaxID=180675 RepID=A0A8X8YXG0_SALSN|nr:hypothetical protein SASPL_156052 [Salvia splendens]